MYPENSQPQTSSKVDQSISGGTMYGGMQSTQGENNTQIQQEVREGGVFVAGNVIFHDSKLSHVQSKSYQFEREPPSLLPYLPNRSDQEFELGKVLQKCLKQVQPHPLVCIVHGDEFQSHDKFLERLRKLSLPRLLGCDPSETIIKEYPLDWPPKLKNLDELQDRLCKHLADSVLGYSFASLEEINASFCKCSHPIIIHTHLITEDWQNEGFGILEKLLEFWQSWPPLAPGQKLIVCLSIKYQLKRQKDIKIFSLFSYFKAFFRWRRCRNINKKIYKYIEEVITLKFKKFNRLSCIVLSELTGVSRMHVENWARSEETKQFVGEAMIEKLIDDIGQMFDHWEAQTSSNIIPMDNLAENLTNLLKSLNSNKNIY